LVGRGWYRDKLGPKKEKGKYLRDMEYMNDAQRAQLAELVAKWSAYKTLKVDDYVRLELLACVLVEVSQLQAYVNTNGTTYQVVGKSGDTYSRARPEYQQLQELRQRASVIIDKLVKDAAPVDDEYSELLA
jgi:hypothetical protein